MKKALSVLILMVAVAACSQQSRTTDPGISGDQVLSQLGSFAGANGASTTSVTINGQPTGDTNQVYTWASDSTSTVFFAEGFRSSDWTSTAPMGSPVTVAAFTDFTVFGLPGIDPTQIQDVQAFYVEDQGHSGLLVAIELFDGNGYTVTAFTGTSSSSSGGYTASLSNQNSQIAVSSSDVDGDGNLLSNIQLQVSDGGGNPIGQFSIMAGFRH